MTYEEQKQWAFDVIGDLEFALQRKKRQYNNYLKHDAVNAAAQVAMEIESMEGELQFEQELYDLTFQ